MWQLHYNWYKCNIQLTIMLQLVYDFDTYDRPMYTHFHYSLYMKLATSCQLLFVLMQLVVNYDLY